MLVRSIRAALVPLLIVCSLITTRCSSPQTVTPTQDPFAARSPVIRQVLTGITGNNNVEFVELYNPSDSVQDLAGYQLVYRLATSEQDLPVTEFGEAASIPPHGFFLLTRQGAEFDITADALFEQSLNDSGGGLGLIGPNGTLIDAVGWGNAPPQLTEGKPAPAVENGQALIRQSDPAGVAQDRNDNEKDFLISDDFDPHNSGSEPTPKTDNLATLAASFPASVDPGQEFEAEVTLSNKADSPLTELQVTIPIPSDVTVATEPKSVEVTAGEINWRIPSLAQGEVANLTLTLQAPWRFGALRLPSPRITEGTAGAFAGPSVIQLNEVPIPVSVARQLIDKDVMVEGTATIYTGGLFAGSGNVKFYMSDGTGGVQVWVPGGEGNLHVGIGDEVRVRGRIERYRGTIELIAEPPSAVELVEANQQPPEPVPVALDELAAAPEAYAGQLVTVEGELARADESSFGFDLELQNERGAALFAYIDEMTGLGIDGLSLDQPYVLTGILETPDGVATLYPRIDDDLEQQYPATLLLRTVAPPNILPAERAVVRLNLANHTGGTVNDLTIHAPFPAAAAILADVSDGGTLVGDSLQWAIGSLGSDESASVSYTFRSRGSVGTIQLPPAEATAGESALNVQSSAQVVYVGDTVPLYAIQGSQDRSPFVGQDLQTEGIVTAVFPELGGLFLQGTPDGDPATSDGLFVAADPLPADIQPGDQLSATGTIRELSHQTTLQVGRTGKLEVSRSGQSLPAALPLDPPAGSPQSLSYFEALEGMLVKVEEPAVAVGPTNQYGETPLVLERYHVSRVFRQDPNGRLITVDDGSDFYHEDRSTMPYAVTTGQTLNDLRGPLAYTFGQYKIEPIHAPRISGSPAVSPSAQPQAADGFKIMTWNAENLFDILEPNPSNPPRPHKDEYDLDLAKVAATIELAGAPTVVALQEVENIGILQDLASLPSLMPFQYTPLLLEGTDSRGIDVGYLVRSGSVTIVDLKQLAVPEGLTSRPPLQLDLDVSADGTSHRIAIFNNHFTALSAGVELTEPRRQAQANLNAEAVRALTADPSYAGFVVLGDLNSFYQDPALSPLEEAGLTDALAQVPAGSRYTYIYQGISQVLDHIYLSDGLSACLQTVQILHADADFPPPERGDPSAVSKSDHDPVIATFGCLP